MIQVIKEGKTNWKYILILLILSITVGAGLLSYLKYFQRKIMFLTDLPTLTSSEKPVLENTNIILRKIKKKFPLEYTIKKSVFFDIDGDKIKEVGVVIFNENLPLWTENQEDIYIFKQDLAKNEFKEVYVDKSRGLMVDTFLAYDFDDDGKEELFIGRNSGGTASVLVWYIISYTEGDFLKIEPPSKYVCFDLLGIEIGGNITIPGRNKIDITENGLIKETNPLHLAGTEPWWLPSGGYLIVYYQFKNKKLEIVDCKLEPPSDSETF